MARGGGTVALSSPAAVTTSCGAKSSALNNTFFTSPPRPLPLPHLLDIPQPPVAGASLPTARACPVDRPPPAPPPDGGRHGRTLRQARPVYRGRPRRQAPPPGRPAAASPPPAGWHPGPHVHVRVRGAGPAVAAAARRRQGVWGGETRGKPPDVWPRTRAHGGRRMSAAAGGWRGRLQGRPRRGGAGPRGACWPRMEETRKNRVTTTHTHSLPPDRTATLCTSWAKT